MPSPKNLFLLIPLVVGMFFHSPMPVLSQEPEQELRNFIKVQQARMDELAKVLEEQKLLIQNQANLLEKQANKLRHLPGFKEIEIPSPNKANGQPVEIKISSQAEGALPLEIEPSPELVKPIRQVKDNGMMAVWGKDGRLTFESEDKSFKARIGGLFQFDVGFYSLDPYVQRLLEPPGLQQGSDFRRARLRSDGYCYDYMEWVFEMDFSRAADLRKDVVFNAPVPSVYLNNVYVGLRDMPWVGTIRVGHIKEELSFYTASSNKNLPFMERPNVFDGLEDPYIYDNGITISRTYLDDFLYSWMGLFQTNTRVGAFGISDEAALAFDVRLCMMPIYDEENNHWMNIGATGSIRANPNEFEGNNKGLPVGQITVSPLVRAGDSFQVPNLINTRSFFTNEGTELYSICFNYAKGPLSIGAQYDGQFFNQSYVGGLPAADGTLAPGVKSVGNLYFDGYSVEILRFLTRGDHRAVNKLDPSYMQVIPVENFSFGKRGNGIGAWEAGLKYDLVRAQVDVPGESMPRGGYLSSATIGLNWFLNPNATFMTNYVYTTGLFGPVERSNAAFHSFGTRFQFVF